VLGVPTIGLLLGLFFCATFAFANLETTFTLFAHRRYDLTEQGVGRIFGYIGVWVVVVQGSLIGPLTRALGEKKLVVLGLSLLGLGLCLLPGPHGLGLLHLVLIPVAVGNGLNNPSLSSLISQYSPAERRGEVLGAAQSLSSLARILGPLWGNYLLTHGLAWPYLVAGALMMGTALLSLRLFRSPAPTEAGGRGPLQPALSEAGPYGSVDMKRS
jgi:fucose permease